jgi:hypothetical protein
VRIVNSETSEKKKDGVAVSQKAKAHTQDSGSCHPGTGQADEIS